MTQRNTRNAKATAGSNSRAKSSARTTMRAAATAGGPPADQYRHCKPILVLGRAALLEVAGIAEARPSGAPATGCRRSGSGRTGRFPG